MGSFFDKILPIGGMNWDDENRVVNHDQNGQRTSFNDYRYAKNIRTAITKANKGKTLTNVLGNLAIKKYVLPYSGGAFPNGVNKCLGACADETYHTVIFMVWNSNGNHQVLRYFRNNTDPDNPYGEVQQVMMYDFGWQKNQRITSLNLVYGVPSDNGPCDILYFADPVPKMIDLTTCNICYKQKSWNLYAGQSNLFSAPGNFHFQLSDFGNNILGTVNIALGAQPDNTTALKLIAADINANHSAFITATACDCHLEITEVGTASFHYSTTGYPLITVPNNWYGDTLTDRLFDRCKWPAMQSPQALYKPDTSFLPNYVQKKVFRFRLQYLYRTSEEAALGVWSQIPINNLQCDGTDNPLLNYVDIDFNDSLLIDPTTLILLRRIRFVAAQVIISTDSAGVQSTGFGNDKAVKDLTPCDFLDYQNGAWTCHFKFYNDIISNDISPAVAAKLFDNVPLEVDAELFSKNRITEGGILEGYDAPECPDVDFTITIDNTKNKPLHKIKGRIRVFTYGMVYWEQPENGPKGFYNFYPANIPFTWNGFTVRNPAGVDKYPFFKPTGGNLNNGKPVGGIFINLSNQGSLPFFGGGGFTSAGPFGIRSGADNTLYDQRMPEGGWPVYAAGTNYLTISKQINVGLATDNLNSLDASSNTKRDAIGQYFNNFMNTPNDLYSEFELNVPDGAYVIRLASHWCSFGIAGIDKLQKGFAYDLNNGTFYQKTSTNTCGVYDSNGGWLNEKEIVVTVSGGDVYCGDFVVMDITPPVDAVVTDNIADVNVDSWQPISGYLYDGTANPLGQGNTQMNSLSYVGEPVEKTIVGFSGEQTADTGLAWEETCITDHNGFWFGISSHIVNNFYIKAYQVGLAPSFITKIVNENPLLWTGTVTDFFNKTLSPINFAQPNGAQSNQVPYQLGLVSCFITTDTATAREACSTIVKGKIIDDNSNPVSGALVIYTNGQYGYTDINGNYSIIAWGDMLTPNSGQFSLQFNPISGENRLYDRLVLFVQAICNPSYPTGEIHSPVSITLISTTGYSPTNPFLIPNIEIVEGSSPAESALKRGGKFIVGGRLNDFPGRLCSVFGFTELYVPLGTEDLSNYKYVVDSNGDPYPQGTYLPGKPTVHWKINFKPPKFASDMQFVRTKNLIYGRYLQWVANQVVYVSRTSTASTPEIITTFISGDATAIKISLANIVAYFSENNSSKVGYSFQAGDRLRLLYDRNLNPFVNSTIYPNIQGVDDFEITSFDATGQFIYVKNNGFPYEIKSGSVIEIYNPKSIANTEQQIFYEIGDVIKCTSPGNTNNDFSQLSGTLVGGDTYWRGRFVPVEDEVADFISEYSIVIEDANVSDFYPSFTGGEGRIGIIDPYFKQVYRPTLMRATDEYLPDTLTNGLSSFPTVSEIVLEKELDRKYGNIQMLLYEQNNMIAICSNKEISNYTGRTTLYQAQSGTGVQAESGDFFGTEFIHAQNLGTDFPATIIANSGNAFGWTNTRSNVWRYQQDGEVVISDAKMVTFFKQLTADGVSDAVAVYDRFNEQYIITYRRNHMQQIIVNAGSTSSVVLQYDNEPPFNTFDDVRIQYLTGGTWLTVTGQINDIHQDEQDLKFYVQINTDSAIPVLTGKNINLIYSLPETIAWFEGTAHFKANGLAQRWACFYDFTPENYCALGTEVFSFVDGKLWIHDKNPVANNFYGVQYNSRITPILNDKPELVKVWNACAIMGYQDNGKIDWFAPTITNDNGQLSRLKKAGWRKKEEFFYAYFKRDINDTSIVGANLRIVEGRHLRSSSLVVALENDYTGEVVLYGWDANVTPSMRTGK